MLQYIDPIAVVVSIVLSICIGYILLSKPPTRAAPKRAGSPPPAPKEAPKSKLLSQPSGAAVAAQMSVMSAPAADLAPPKSTPISVAELAQCDGKDASKPIWVAIKGKVYDVTNKREMYGPGAGYNVFAGKDASRGLGMSSLDPKDAVSDYSTLNEAQMKTLDQWDSFFAKRYNIVGKVVP
ncbi:hypothetical protein CspeluHIS016_0403680 [Cutaneotrichosporon spelunceum]|uniref:Cytochrome b5 heme-binding domain-containing protein n=1 Tax=Cutaneotrichosporon spelunceum TaxID=1672016 RepID=A0AAD3YD49_9TREE|nr:hypothetical protein CspeluHIS016_0403680 [Cutaneotrichosporon spelunceum]